MRWIVRGGFGLRFDHRILARKQSSDGVHGAGNGRCRASSPDKPELDRTFRRHADRVRGRMRCPAETSQRFAVLMMPGCGTAVRDRIMFGRKTHHPVQHLENVELSLRKMMPDIEIQTDETEDFVCPPSAH